MRARLSNNTRYQIYIGDQFDTHTLKRAMTQMPAHQAFANRESVCAGGSSGNSADVSKGQMRVSKLSVGVTN